MKGKIMVAFFLLIGIVSAAVYHFTIKGRVEVGDGELTVSPQSFTAEIRGGAVYVKRITIENYGGAKSIYFESVVEGPDPDAVDVEVHDIYGNTITSSNRLVIPEGTGGSPGVVVANVHVSVDDDADEGSYTIYIMAKET